MKIRSICVAAALACAASGVQAATFGELSVPTESYLGVYATPFFADSVSFSLTGLSTVYSDTKIYGGAGGYALFSGATMIGGLHTLGSAASFSGLTAGTYTFGYFGMGSGLSAVTLSANAVPAVPEPASYAMLLAGLGMVAGMARRRLS